MQRDLRFCSQRSTLVGESDHTHSRPLPSLQPELPNRAEMGPLKTRRDVMCERELAWGCPTSCLTSSFLCHNSGCDRKSDASVPRARCAPRDTVYLQPPSGTAFLLRDPAGCARFIYDPFSGSSSELRVSNESLQWLLKGLLASSLAAKFLQVTVTDHGMAESQRALKDAHAQERITVWGGKGTKRGS